MVRRQDHNLILATTDSGNHFNLMHPDPQITEEMEASTRTTGGGGGGVLDRNRREMEATSRRWGGPVGRRIAWRKWSPAREDLRQRSAAAAGRDGVAAAGGCERLLERQWSEEGGVG